MTLLKSRVLVALILACFAVTASPAAAGTRRVEDPRDVGEGGGWDVKWAQHGHTETGRIKHTFRSYAGISDIAGACLTITTSKGDRFQSCGDAMYDRDTNERVGAVRERRPNPRTIVITFRKSVIGNPAAYRWKMNTYGYCEFKSCDRAPDSGRIRHRL